VENAVPAYQHDQQGASATIGEMYLYIRQLTHRIEELAEQANKIDDERIELGRANVELTTQLSSAHEHNNRLQARVNELETEDDCDCCDR
jgi:chromosome segregation ATPase